MLQGQYLLFLFVSDEVAKENKGEKKISQSEKPCFKTVMQLDLRGFGGDLLQGR